MADTKITGLTADTSPSSTDIVPSVKDPTGTPLNRKVSLLNIVKGGWTGLATTLGDIAYSAASGVMTRLAGNTTSTKKYLVQTGTGSVSAAPGWDTIAAADLPAATTSAQGAAELATTAEINTGTDTGRVLVVDQFAASEYAVRYILVRAVEAATNVANGTTVGGDVESPIAGTITGVGVYNDTAGTGTAMTVDINKNGATLMGTTKITVDGGEKSSRTAETAAVLTVTTLAVGDILTMDVDAIHGTTAAKGLSWWVAVRE